MIIRQFKIPDPQAPLEERVSDMEPSRPLIDFIPSRLEPQTLIGMRIDGYSPFVGTYGMGGAGFFGLRFGSEWLVIALWGAAQWMHAGGRLIADYHYETHGRAEPWLIEGPSDSVCGLDDHLIGKTVQSIAVEPHAFFLEVENRFALAIEQDPAKRPHFPGTKEPRKFSRGDDLREAIFWAPTTEIWI